MKKLILILKYIFIGILQGISEILPISSSGHLAITYHLLKITDEHQLQLTIFLHFASSLALCLFYKKTLLSLLKGFYLYVFKKNQTYKNDFKLTIYLMVASIPAIIFGLLIEPLIEKTFQQLFFVALGFILTSLILFISSKIKIQKESSYSIKNTFITGLFQVIAIIPGISRSATTFLGSKVAKLDERKGKDFTFLLLIPISLGSTFLTLFKNATVIFSNSENLILYLIAMIIAFLFTHLSLKLIYKIQNLKGFSIYMLMIGIFFLIFFY